MKSIKFRFAMFCVLVFWWLAFCCMACDPTEQELTYNYGSDIAAYKPDKVDSLALRVTYQVGDSIWADTAVNSESDARIICRETCDSLFSLGRENKISIDISFYCSGNVVALPTFEVNSHSDSWKPEELNFRFLEYDERSVRGDFQFEKFLPPEDTSCGKFVNYVVLRLKCSHGWCY